ncbi:MAG: quinone-dependent dihydroorotate dehydrogenase [Leucothrix sp.]
MYTIARALLFRLSGETSHDVTLKALTIADRLGLVNLLFGAAKPSATNAAVEVMGIRFPNKVGLAAGLDKNGDHILAMANLGFGFVEIGTVTPLPQLGNPKPRLFRLPQAQAIINRMGFNNKGVDHLVENVKQARATGFDGIIGINIGKNAVTPVEKAQDDYLICLKKVYPHASYITINISSPNTPGLRSLQYGEELKGLLLALKDEQKDLAESTGRYVPLAVKVAPDLTEAEVEGISACLLAANIDALIATNTTLKRDKVDGLQYGDEVGGLSGAPVTEQSTQIIAMFAKHLNGQLPIIGVGGILSAKDAQEKIEAGSDLVQVYSGFIYKGPALVKDCVKQLER